MKIGMMTQAKSVAHPIANGISQKRPCLLFKSSLPPKTSVSLVKTRGEIHEPFNFGLHAFSSGKHWSASVSITARASVVMRTIRTYVNLTILLCVPFITRRMKRQADSLTKSTAL